MDTVKVLSPCIIFIGIICGFSHFAVATKEVQGMEKAMSDDAEIAMKYNRQKRDYRTAGSSPDRECPNTRESKSLDEMMKCPATFCQHVTYRCSLHCPRTEIGITCELNNCTGTHHCSSGSDVIIPVDEVCDDKAQCPDADDEVICERKCRPFCMCIGLLVDFSAIPMVDTRFPIKNISIANSKGDLSSAEYSSFLSYLDIKNAQAIPYQFLSGLYNLRVLDISSNNISSVPDNIFRNLSSLVSLDLSSSLIFHLPDNMFSGLSSLYTLDLSKNKIVILSHTVFRELKGLRKLYLNNNQISVLPDNVFIGLSSLITLYLHNNHVSVLPANIFSGLSSLTTLTLYNNQISVFPKYGFSGLVNISYIFIGHNKLSVLPVLPFSIEIFDISHNHVTSISSGSFIGFSKLSYLNIVGNNIEISENMFVGLDNLLALVTDTPFMCCVKPKSVAEDKCSKDADKIIDCFNSPEKCFPEAEEDDAISSCYDLIGSNIQKVSLWIIGVCALIGNFAVIVYRLFFDRDDITKSYSLFVVNLSVSDFLMGVYLLIIGVADEYYRGEYAWNAQQWRRSAVCTTAGVLSTISSEMSTFLILLVTIDRVIVIVFPLSRLSHRNISGKQATIISVSFWLISAALAMIPIVFMQSYFKGEFYSQSGVCLPLPLTSAKRPGTEYSFAVFVCLNSLVFIVIAIGHICMFKSLMSCDDRAASARTREGDTSVAVTLFLVVATDFLCWFPIGIMGVTSQYGYQIPDEVYAWVMIFVLPINAAINPFLYTASAVWRKRKRERRAAEMTEMNAACR